MPSLMEIEGIGPTLAAACVKNKYRTIAKIAAARPAELSVVPGISEKRAKLIIVSAKSLLSKSRIPKITNNKKRKSVAPLKVGADANSLKTTDENENLSSRLVKKETKLTELGMSDSKNSKKIENLKKKIKKLKKEKKKL